MTTRPAAFGQYGKWAPHHIPYVIQTGRAPMFVGAVSTGVHLRCECSHILVENFEQDAFAAIGIRCSECGAITDTAPLPDGEVIPPRWAILGDLKGHLPNQQALSVYPDVIVTTDIELDRVTTLTSPRRGPRPNLRLTREGIRKLQEDFDASIGGGLERQLASLGRYPENDPRGILQYPFAWATRLLAKHADDGVNIGDPKMGTAVYWAWLFNRVRNVWQHHPRYAAVAKTFKSSFLHSAPQLLVADHLHACHARVGFTVDGDVGEKNPDFYIRQSRTHNLSVEVKGPQILQWIPEKSIDEDDLRNAVLRSLESSKKQITEFRPGILTIVSSLVHDVFPEALLHTMTEVIEDKGARRPWLAGIIGVSPASPSLGDLGDYWKFENNHMIRVAPNPHFVGENPLKPKG